MPSDPPSAYVPNELLGRLVGLGLYAVEFVMDYVQLRFDGPSQERPVLNCDVMPAVEHGGRQTMEGDPGYADALRGVIPGIVHRTHEATGTGLRIEFDGATIAVHPTRADLVGPEIALLQGFADRRWMCWRPGEASFEDLA